MYFDDNKKLTIPTVCRETYHSSPKHVYTFKIYKRYFYLFPKILYWQKHLCDIFYEIWKLTFHPLALAGSLEEKNNKMFDGVVVAGDLKRQMLVFLSFIWHPYCLYVLIILSLWLVLGKCLLSMWLGLSPYKCGFSLI